MKVPTFGALWIPPALWTLTERLSPRTVSGIQCTSKDGRVQLEGLRRSEGFLKLCGRGGRFAEHKKTCRLRIDPVDWVESATATSGCALHRVEHRAVAAVDGHASRFMYHHKLIRVRHNGEGVHRARHRTWQRTVDE